MQGNQNVLPAYRRQAVWEKKRLMEFLAALKKNPLCHSASPSETVSGLSSLFGAVILQHHGAPTSYAPLTAFTCILALGCPSLQNPSRSDCSSQRGARRAPSKAHIVWPCWILLTLGASHSSKEGTKKNLDVGLTALISLVSFLMPCKRPAVHPVPETPGANTACHCHPFLSSDTGAGPPLLAASCHLHTVRAEDLLSHHTGFKLRQTIISCVFIICTGASVFSI